MIAVIDNYDSFTYNLVQYLAELGVDVKVYRNDAVSVEALCAMGSSGVLLSPGPGVPDGSGVTLACVKPLAEAGIPVFGVCLGHQAIAQAFGATVIRADRIMHGRTSEVTHDGKGCFTDVPSPLTATRYHSLIVDPDTVPGDLVVTARAHPGEIMGLRHRTLPVEGVQFHPESFLTEHGRTLLGNFASRGKRGAAVG